MWSAGYGEVKLQTRCLSLMDLAPHQSPAPQKEPGAYSAAEALTDWLQVGHAWRLITPELRLQAFSASRWRARVWGIAYCTCFS